MVCCILAWHKLSSFWLAQTSNTHATFIGFPTSLVMDIAYIFHILLIPSFLHKTFATESPSLYLFSYISFYITLHY